MLIPTENQHISPAFDIDISDEINMSNATQQLYHYYPPVNINMTLTSGYLSKTFVPI